MKSKSYREQLTPAEVIQEYPELYDKLNWTARDIGIFVSKGLLDGLFDRKKRVSFVDTRSIKNLVEFMNKKNSDKIIRL